MNWQDLLKRTPKKVARVSREGDRAQPIITVEPAEPPGFGPEGNLAEAIPEVAEQPRTVRMKDQVMG